jgi:hypothetical protein
MKPGTKVHLIDNPETREWLYNTCFWNVEVLEQLIQQKTRGVVLNNWRYPDVFLVSFPGAPYYCSETGILKKFLKIIT